MSGFGVRHVEVKANPDGTFTRRVTNVVKGKTFFVSATVHKTEEEAKRGKGARA